jgi:hypothetical protein
MKGVVIYPLRGSPTMSNQLSNTRHALDRAGIRLKAGEYERAVAAASLVYNRSEATSMAIVALDLGHHRTTDGAGVESNGDMVVLIVTNGAVTTAYLRRSTQPMTKEWVRGRVAKYGGTMKVKWARGTEAAKKRNTQSFKHRRGGRRY